MVMHGTLSATTFVILLPPALGMTLSSYHLVFAAALWLVVGVVAWTNGGHLTRTQDAAETLDPQVARGRVPDM